MFDRIFCEILWESSSISSSIWFTAGVKNCFDDKPFCNSAIFRRFSHFSRRGDGQSVGRESFSSGCDGVFAVCCDVTRTSCFSWMRRAGERGDRWDWRPGLVGGFFDRSRTGLGFSVGFGVGFEVWIPLVSFWVFGATTLWVFLALATIFFRRVRSLRPGIHAPIDSGAWISSHTLKARWETIKYK